MHTRNLLVQENTYCICYCKKTDLTFGTVCFALLQHHANDLINQCFSISNSTPQVSRWSRSQVYCKKDKLLYNCTVLQKSLLFVYLMHSCMLLSILLNSLYLYVTFITVVLLSFFSIGVPAESNILTSYSMSFLEKMKVQVCGQG